MKASQQALAAAASLTDYSDRNAIGAIEGAQSEVSGRHASAHLAVLLVEDSALLAERLRESLLDVPKARLVGRADNETDAIAILRRSSVDVLLLDINLSQGSAFGVLRAIPTGQNKNAVAIILTNHDLAEYRRAADALGARYFLDKARDFERLPELLRKIEADLSTQIIAE